MNRRRLACSLAGAAILGLLTSVATAGDAQPAKKDSPAFIRPKEVTLTARVVPAEAKPGETVTYTVTAKVQEPWHIYAYAKEQPDDGPKVTQFDFFDPAGLKVSGDWKPSREPISKKEPAFPDLDKVSYYEGEVSWSVALQVPDGTEPGEKELKSQISFMICKEATCKPPARITAPSAKVTVLGGGSVPKAKAKPAGAEKTTSTQPTKPDQDNNPKQVRFTSAIKPALAKPGDRVSLEVKAELDPGWHIFTVAPAEGPGQNTTFDLFDLAGLAPDGDWAASAEPTIKPDPAGLAQPPLEYFEGEVTWTLPLQVPADAEPGAREVRAQVQFQVCSDQFCNRGRLTLPPVALAVLSADAAPAGEIAAAPPLAPEPAETPATAAAAKTEMKTEVEQKLQQGIVPFLLLSAGAGLLALVMPCVWPMVPITVNFFVKQGHSRRGGSTTGLAITYCASIIVIYTLVGVLFSAIFGRSAQDLAVNPWLNAFVALMFVGFGLSLLGLFEFRLPSFLVNASSRGEGRGGLIGVVFMALTLTITSFTCTFPVVGGLLVMAASGEYFYPIIGLMTFATVLALPFFLLALAPGAMARLPRGGDWMNAVKVVGGLVELGAAFKFVNNAEIGFGTPQDDAFFNAPVVLALWIALAFVCGIYLLGLFRTDHDHDAVKVGPMRLLFGASFLFLGVLLTPALFRRPPQSQIWNQVIALLPPDVHNLTPEPVAVATGGEAVGPVKATSEKPAEAIRQEQAFHGVRWGFSYDQAVEQARAQNRPVLIDFTGVYCTNCRQMEQTVMPRKEVVERLRRFVTVQLYTDLVPIDSISLDDRTRLAEENQEIELKLVRDTALPYYVAVGTDGQVLATIGGSRSPQVFVEFLDRALGQHQAAGKQVARAGR